MSHTDALLFPGFSTLRIQASGAEIQCVVGGSGPAVLMLHGFPQTHSMWHRVAPALARTHTVVCADLRGYGDSSKPSSSPDHAPYSKRAMAQDMLEVMTHLGHRSFAVVGHDRGGRVAHRLLRDHPHRVSRLAVLDISPTATMYGATDFAFASAYYHWFFLIQPHDLPERMIGNDPLYYLHKKMSGWGSGGLGVFDPRALAEYERCFAAPAAIHAMCEDYRASASIDLVHDAADATRITCPLLVLWGDKGVVNRLFHPLADWRAIADNVSGRTLPTGHYLAEEAPDTTLAELERFLGEG